MAVTRDEMREFASRIETVVNKLGEDVSAIKTEVAKLPTLEAQA